MAHVLLYGGTFDPIHHGHLITCRAAKEVLKADVVLLVPAHVSPHKAGGGKPGGAVRQASAENRLRMIQIAISGQRDFAVDDLELRRPGPSYTIDTVRQLKSTSSDRFTLLIGSDQLAKLHTWHKIKELLQEVEIAVLARPGSGDLSLDLAVVEQELGPACAKQVRGRMLSTPLMQISGTVIRARVREGLPISFLLPEGVARYIAERGLYLGEKG